MLVSTENELQLWQHRWLTDNGYQIGITPSATDEETSGVRFMLGEHSDRDAEFSEKQDQASEQASSSTQWECVWRQFLAQPIRYLKFSPDGLLFATAGIVNLLYRCKFTVPKTIFYRTIAV